jgi:hypothetical protein
MTTEKQEKQLSLAGNNTPPQPTLVLYDRAHEDYTETPVRIEGYSLDDVEFTTSGTSVREILTMHQGRVLVNPNAIAIIYEKYE